MAVEINDLQPLTDANAQEWRMAPQWCHHEALYLIKGFYPPENPDQHSTSHFPEELSKINAEERSLSDTPRNWLIWGYREKLLNEEIWSTSEIPLQDDEKESISFQEVFRILKSKHENLSPEEVTIWAFYHTGTLRPYRDEALTEPFDFSKVEIDSLEFTLEGMFFSKSRLGSFDPDKPYICGRLINLRQLIERWANSDKGSTKKTEKKIKTIFNIDRGEEEAPRPGHPTSNRLGVHWPCTLKNPTPSNVMYELKIIEKYEENSFSPQEDSPPYQAEAKVITEPASEKAAYTLTPKGVETSATQESAQPLASVGQSGDVTKLNLFRNMEGLQWHEITITFLADGRLKVEARGKICPVLLSDLNLISAQTTERKREWEVLFLMARGMKLVRDGRNKSVLKRLRKILKSTFQIGANPFKTDKDKGWLPIFSVKDRTAAADERAKEKARHVEFNGNMHGATTDHNIFEEEYPFEDKEGDAASQFINKKSP